MKKKIILSGILVVLLLIGFCVKQNFQLKKIEEEKSLVSVQTEYEKEIKTEGYTIDEPNVVVNPYHNSPLTALVIFNTENEVVPKVTIVGRDKNTTFTHTFKKGKEHVLPIYGLYPDKKNEVIVSYEENDMVVKKSIWIEAEKLPDDFIIPTSVKADKELVGNDLYFFTPSSKGYTCAYDVNGDVRWYLSQNALWDNTRLQNGHMMISTERLVNAPYYMTGLYEIDLLGKIYQEYSLPGGYHHDYFELPNGNLLVASNDFYNESGTVEDYVVELDRKTGSVVKTFDLKNILHMEDGKSENWSPDDWFHNNAVWYDEKTDSITLSGRHKDAVINIDYKTGKLNWIIGDSTNWDEEYKKYFFTPVGDNFEWQWSQHAAMITPEGYVFVLDNGNNKSKIKEEYVPATKSYTRGVLYKMNTKEMTIEQIWEYGKERGSAFYSPYISDVDYLGKNHSIVHSGGIVYVDGKNSNQPAGLGGADKLVSDTVEILNDKVIFEIVLPTNTYRVEKMALYNDTEFQFGRAKRVGSLGETTVNDKKLVFHSKKQDDAYASHSVSLKQQEDRLVLSGQFKKTDKVKVVLQQGILAKEYHVAISKKPYTALCLDIFTEEENEKGIVVTKYIHREGLKGDYKVFVEINGTMYRVGQVNF